VIEKPARRMIEAPKESQKEKAMESLKEQYHSFVKNLLNELSCQFDGAAIPGRKPMTP
jgi:hypothetical protein